MRGMEETRIALIGILVEEPESVEQMNRLASPTGKKGYT